MFYILTEYLALLYSYYGAHVVDSIHPSFKCTQVRVLWPVMAARFKCHWDIKFPKTWGNSNWLASDSLVSVPDQKPTPAQIAFSYTVEVIYVPDEG